jgi:hypothetical protein
MNAAQRIYFPLFKAKAMAEAVRGPLGFGRGTPPKRRRPFKDQLEWRVVFGKVALDNKVRLR